MWLSVSCDHQRGRDAHSELSSAAHRETRKIALFLAAGFARVAIKRTPFERCTSPVKCVLYVLFHALLLAPAFSLHQQSINCLQTS